jgi:hypothetical protein
MGELEAFGDAVTGGLIARAVEPQAGEAGPDGHTHETNCLNCGAPLTGPYCAACGQKAHIHRSVRAFFQDFIQGLFNFEGKIWRTLPMLAWRPGEMTRRYIAGERARFISPVALYLFTVFIMFAVLNLTGTLGSGSLGSGPAKGFQSALKADLAEEQTALAKLEAQRKTAQATGQSVADLDREIAKRKEDIADSQKIISGQAFATAQVDEDTPSWVRPMIENVTKNPEAVSMKIQDAASKFSWLLIPISVPFLWLLFPFRRRYNTYDHTVFVTYSLSFMMMLVVVGGLLVAAGVPSLASLLFFVPPFHMYWHLKGAYQLGRASALLRTTALLMFAFVAVAFFFAVTVALGAM